MTKSTSSTFPTPINTTTLSAIDLEAIVFQVFARTAQPSASAFFATSGTSSLLIDSDCCNHMTFNSDIFYSKYLPSQPTSISTTDGSIMPVTHTGTVSSNNIYLSDVYFVPQLSLNLISVGQLCDLDLHLFFSRASGLIQDPLTKTTVGIGHKIGRLFELPPSRAYHVYLVF